MSLVEFSSQKRESDRRAIDLDPNFASAYAQLAIATIQAASYYQATSIAEALDQTLGNRYRSESIRYVCAPAAPMVAS